MEVHQTYASHAVPVLALAGFNNIRRVHLKGRGAAYVGTRPLCIFVYNLCMIRRWTFLENDQRLQKLVKKKDSR